MMELQVMSYFTTAVLLLITYCIWTEKLDELAGGIILAVAFVVGCMLMGAVLMTVHGVLSFILGTIV